MTLLDTDILIDVGRGDKLATHYLQMLENHENVAISIITEMELMVGCRNKREQSVVEKFLKRFEILPLGESVSIRAVTLLKKYRLSHGLLIPDALIAATALEYQFSFVSKNQRDYRFIEGLQLLPYPPSLD